MFEEEQRNSILMMVTTQIWVVVLLHVGHQYGISAVTPQVFDHKFSWGSYQWFYCTMLAVSQAYTFFGSAFIGP